jgi:hypothetical protein
LNEYRTEKGERNLNEFEVSQTLDSLNYLRLFIKWLVDNDKIDKSKVFSFIDTADKPYEDILCLLALSDEPISDLISFLK